MIVLAAADPEVVGLPHVERLRLVGWARTGCDGIWRGAPQHGGERGVASLDELEIANGRGVEKWSRCVGSLTLRAATVMDRGRSVLVRRGPLGALACTETYAPSCTPTL